MGNNLDGINWVIIGATTGTKKDMEALIQRYPDLTLKKFHNKYSAQPKIEWVEEIIESCNKVGIAIFLKDNLKPFLDTQPTRIVYQYGSGKLRQELPDKWRLRIPI